MSQRHINSGDTSSSLVPLATETPFAPSPDSEASLFYLDNLLSSLFFQPLSLPLPPPPPWHSITITTLNRPEQPARSTAVKQLSRASSDQSPGHHHPETTHYRPSCANPSSSSSSARTLPTHTLPWSCPARCTKAALPGRRRRTNPYRPVPTTRYPRNSKTPTVRIARGRDAERRLVTTRYLHSHPSSPLGHPKVEALHHSSHPHVTGGTGNYRSRPPHGNVEEYPFPREHPFLHAWRRRLRRARSVRSTRTTGRMDGRVGG